MPAQTAQASGPPPGSHRPRSVAICPRPLGADWVAVAADAAPTVVELVAEVAGAGGAAVGTMTVEGSEGGLAVPRVSIPVSVAVLVTFPAVTSAWVTWWWFWALQIS